MTGPSLAAFGITNPLPNPTLTLVRSSDGTVIATNDDWQVQANPADVAALQASGLQPSDPREPAIIATLQPGLYTAIASGVGDHTGVAVVSVYQASSDVAITSANNTAFTVGTAGTFTVTTAGTPAATSVTATGALPAGVTFTPGTSTGTLSGTPAAGTGGTYSLTITASNGGVTPNGTQTFTLTVNEAPAITSANSATFQTASPNAHTVVATGFPAPTLSVTGALPAGVSFNPATGVLAGTPSVARQLPARLYGRQRRRRQRDAELHAHREPDGGDHERQRGHVHRRHRRAASRSRPARRRPRTSITTAGALPAGVTLGATSGTGTAVLSGTPGPGTGRRLHVTITASNGGVTPNGTQTFTLTVHGQAQTIRLHLRGVRRLAVATVGPTYNVDRRPRRRR